jgi:predicted DNA-binding transcriptional regulator YafY
MSKQIYFTRYHLIINRLRKSPATFQEIQKYLEDASELYGKDFTITQRTLQRDIKDIFDTFNIEIVNERKGDKKYRIAGNSETEDTGIRLLEAYQMINSIEVSQQNAQSVFFESRKSKGLEHFAGLVYAIKNKKIVAFEHYKYYDDILTERKVHPLGLKESQGRWYLIGVDTKDSKLKTFGLDRIENLNIKETKFREKYEYNLNELFANYFGVLTYGNKPAETVRLQFTYEQGQYVKNYPLHHSQKTEKDDIDNDEVIISLTICSTDDFVMELLKYGSSLKVIAPASLKKLMKEELSLWLANY